MFGAVLVAGAAVGIARGGRPGRLAGLVLYRPLVVWVALGLQLLLGSRFTKGLPDGARFGLVVASYLLVGAWLVFNAGSHSGATRTAFWLLAGGWLLNVAAIAPNGGMPVSLSAHEAVGSPGGESVSDGHLWKHVPADADTVLRPLGDVIPLSPIGAVVSVGDLVMLAGIVWLVGSATGPPLPAKEGQAIPPSS